MEEEGGDIYIKDPGYRSSWADKRTLIKSRRSVFIGVVDTWLWIFAYVVWLVHGRCKQTSDKARIEGTDDRSKKQFQPDKMWRATKFIVITHGRSVRGISITKKPNQNEWPLKNVVIQILRSLWAASGQALHSLGDHLLLLQLWEGTLGVF